MKRKTKKKDRRFAAGRRKAAPPRIKASLELALLGLIAEQHPRSGYDLVQTFRISMSHYWHAHPGQIYPTLDRMERDGWIAGREVIQRGRPNKRVYSITAEGRRILLEWLRSPYEPLKMKNPPLLRSRFLGHLGADGARAKFAEVRDAMTAYLEELRGYDRLFAGEGRAIPGRQPDVRLFHPAARNRVRAERGGVLRMGDRRDRAASRFVRR